MNKRVKIVLLGLMIWAITFIAGAFVFLIFNTGEGEPSTEILVWANGLKEFAVGIGLALALFLLFRDKGQNYKRTAWEAGITWYVILLLMDLIVLVALAGIKLDFWFPSIFTYFTVAIIPIVVGYLLANSKTNFNT